MKKFKHFTTNPLIYYYLAYAICKISAILLANLCLVYVLRQFYSFSATLSVTSVVFSQCLGCLKSVRHYYLDDRSTKEHFKFNHSQNSIVFWMIAHYHLNINRLQKLMFSKWLVATTCSKNLKIFVQLVSIVNLGLLIDFCLSKAKINLWLSSDGFAFIFLN